MTVTYYIRSFLTSKKAITDDEISSSIRFILTVEGASCTSALFYTSDSQKDVGSCMSIVVVVFNCGVEVVTSFGYDGQSSTCN
jgi:hypothetical protein